MFGNAPTGSTLFGGASTTGGSLFNQSNLLFTAKPNIFSKPANDDDDDEDDDPNFGKGDNSPVSYNPDAKFEGSTATNLKIESKPISKSPYTKVFNVRVYIF